MVFETIGNIILTKQGLIIILVVFILVNGFGGLCIHLIKKTKKWLTGPIIALIGDLTILGSIVTVNFCT